MIHQLWFAVIGMNGDGMLTKVNNLSSDMVTVKIALPQLATKEELAVKLEKHSERGRISWQFWLALVMPTLGSIAAILVAVLK